MTISNKANVTDRTSKGRPLTIEEHDRNIEELRNVIDDARQNEINHQAHLDSPTAHDAFEIVYDNTTSGLTATDTQAALDELDSLREQHEDSPTAHDAVQIVYDNTTSGLTATNTQAALDEIDQNLDDHLASSTAHDAFEIVYDNTTTGFAATNSQAAIDELDAKLNDHVDSTVAHDAVDLVYNNTTSGLAAEDVQSAIDEVENRLDANESGLTNHINSTTAHDASDIVYDNTTSGLTAEDVQSAIDEVGGILDTKADNTDPRLTDSREWTASVVSQAEAEAGTATTARKWTAQRVRQAIVAWWNGATSAWGRGLVSSADAAAGRAALGLENVDNTSDANKRVGSFIIHDTRDVVSIPDDVPARTGLFEFKKVASVGNPPKPSSGTYAHVLSTNGWTADGTGGWPTQVSLGAALSFRKGTGETTWGPWHELISTDTTLGSTGQSTLYPMSQKAVTDALNDKAPLHHNHTIEDVVGLQDALDSAPALLDGLRRSVEAASGGRMTVFYTDKGQPSYFVRQPKFLCEDIAPGGELGTGTHEAFVFNGVEDSEIWIGAFQASVVDGEAVSQPGVAPQVTVNYDQARAFCQAAGAGFDLMTVWDWAAVALWCMAHGFEPRGNTNHGRHHDNRWETGTRQDGGVVGDSAGVGNILTGSGPAEWRHDGTMSGISDLVGNVWEWLTGMKMVDGRVFLSADNAIPSESGYVDTAFNMPNNRDWATIDSTGADVALKRALLVPKGADDPAGYLYTTLTGERLPFRGGNRRVGAGAGLGALDLGNARTRSTDGIGFRPRFRNP